MNAPVSTLTRASGTILPADKQREYDEALRTFWNDGSARLLHLLEGGGMGIAGKRSMPDALYQSDGSWFARTIIEDVQIEGEGATALGALADMMIRAEAKAAEFAQERYEDNMTGAR